MSNYRQVILHDYVTDKYTDFWLSISYKAFAVILSSVLWSSLRTHLHIFCVLTLAYKGMGGMNSGFA